MKRHIFRVAWLVLFSALGACKGLQPTAKTTLGMSRDQYRAAYEIASARCDRQTNACSAFASRAECLDAKLGASAAATRLPRCSNDVDQVKVQLCVEQIRQGQCGTGIAQLAACQKSALCPYQSEEGTM